MERDLSRNLPLVLVSIALALLIAEVGLRLMGVGEVESGEPFDLYYFRDRPDLLRDQRSEFAYEPNSTVRQVVVVVKRAGRTIEYDTTLKTNNLGLVQRRDLSKGEPAIVLIGDSFTEGVGATPWFYDLEAEFLGQRRLANLGVVGTGVQHWERALMWYAANHPVSGLVVLFIEDDFRRPLSWWKKIDGSIANCVDEKCSKPMARLPYSDADFRPFAHPELLGWKRLAKEGLESTRIGSLILQAKRAIVAPISPTQATESDYYQKQLRAGLAAIDRIARKYPGAIFIHLPMAEEARARAWLRDSPAIREHFREYGIRYRDGMRECGLKGADYYAHDPHATAEGYRKIRACVAEIVRAFPDR